MTSCSALVSAAFFGGVRGALSTTKSSPPSWNEETLTRRPGILDGASQRSKPGRKRGLSHRLQHRLRLRNMAVDRGALPHEVLRDGAPEPRVGDVVDAVRHGRLEAARDLVLAPCPGLEAAEPTLDGL